MALQYNITKTLNTVLRNFTKIIIKNIAHMLIKNIFKIKIKITGSLQNWFVIFILICFSYAVLQRLFDIKNIPSGRMIQYLSLTMQYEKLYKRSLCAFGNVYKWKN